MYQFEDFTSSADHDSAQWAASDRGWLYDTSKQRWDGSAWCVGHYLTYAAVPGYREAPMVQAVVFDRLENPITGMDYTTPCRVKACATVQEARAWMIEQHTGQLALV